MSHVLITGASSGLGAALARRYASGGAQLTLAGRDSARLAEVSSHCRQLGARDVAIICCDVTDAGQMPAQAIARDVAAPVDIVIANAGLGGMTVLASNAPETTALAHRIISTNVLGVINTVAPLLPRLLARGTGAIALLSSIAGSHGLAESPVYSASKAAVRTYGHGLRRQLRDTGLTVTIITAGFIDTPMARSLPFHPPFMVPVDVAAERICRHIASGTREDIFPWPLRAGAALLDAMPLALADRVLALTSRLTTAR